MPVRKQNKTYPTEKARLEKKGVPGGKNRRARRARRKAATKALKQLQGSTVKNTATGRQVRIVKDSVKETAHHAQGDTLSTLAAMDARRQIRDAKLVRTAKAKNNRRQTDMKLNEVTVMKGKLLTADTKVIVGKRGKYEHVLYSITAKPRKKK